ncbi:MAG: hypothetical protein ABI026_02025 [Gemmatimonadaceae bacterium]
MTRTKFFALILAVGGSALVLGCQSSQSDRLHRRQLRAKASCEEAVRGHLSSRATAQFDPDSEHVYYDSLGGAAVSGNVSSAGALRQFACILTPASETTWVLTQARLLN